MIGSSKTMVSISFVIMLLSSRAIESATFVFLFARQDLVLALVRAGFSEEYLKSDLIFHHL